MLFFHLHTYFKLNQPKPYGTGLCANLYVQEKMNEAPLRPGTP
jgi:hypothetical protein